MSILTSGSSHGAAVLETGVEIAREADRTFVDLVWNSEEGGDRKVRVAVGLWVVNAGDDR
jgi:hypothetical protein